MPARGLGKNLRVWFLALLDTALAAKCQRERAPVVAAVVYWQGSAYSRRMLRTLVALDVVCVLEQIESIEAACEQKSGKEGRGGGGDAENKRKVSGRCLRGQTFQMFCDTSKYK